METINSERITRIRNRFLNEMPYISVERAKYYTESWKKTEKSGKSRIIRVALAMENVFQKMEMSIEPDDRIVGTWTENWLGIPIDIERGLFNLVLQNEFSKWSMRAFNLKSLLRFAGYQRKKTGIKGIFQILKTIDRLGLKLPVSETATMDKRQINPYQIRKNDRKLLLKELLPFWDGINVAELLQKAFIDRQVYPGDFGGMILNLPKGAERNNLIVASGAALGVWQGHLILDHETPLKKGILGMREEIQGILDNNNDLKPEEKDFLNSQNIALRGIEIFARRLAEKVRIIYEGTKDLEWKQELEKILSICEKVPLYPAETFREALQSFWTVKTAVELAIPFNVHAPGRLDQLFFPYYEQDMENGEISEVEACELLQELFLKIMGHNMRPYSNGTSPYAQRYEGSEPITLGGMTELGEDATNPLTYIMLDAARDSQASLNFAVRIHDNSPSDLWEKVSELHYSGISSVSLMNDRLAIQAMLNRGFTPGDANEYAITGCVDVCSPGKTGGEGFSSLMMCRTLDLAMRNGDSQTPVGLIKSVGLPTGDPNTFTNFQEFVDAFLDQGSFMIQKIVETSRIRDEIFAQYLPAPYISAFMQGCLDSKKDVTVGGAVYDCEGILFMTSIANVVDSLYVIKKLIFEEKAFSFQDLLDAIDVNYIGKYKPILKKILALKGKWGNGNPESDEIARQITTSLFKETYKYRTFKGGFYAPFINSMTTHTIDGAISIATPDGRRAGKPFAASCNPYNVEQRGPIGVLKSVSVLPFEHVMGCAVNIRMHPSGIGKNPITRQKWIQLIKTYFSLGGEQLQPTIASTETLRAAQEDPDSFKGLIVKVGGYSAYFVELGKEIQDEIITRTEHALV